MKVWLKPCPRCTGDLLMKADIEGLYVDVRSVRLGALARRGRVLGAVGLRSS